MPHIELPIDFFSDTPFDKVKAYCNHFGCSISKPRKGDNIYTIQSDNPINFFWLGANVALKSESSLTITPAEKYLKAR